MYVNSVGVSGIKRKRSGEHNGSSKKANTIKPSDNLSTLSDELQLMIYSNLEVRDLASLFQVSKGVSRVAQDASLLKVKLSKIYSKNLSETFKTSDESKLKLFIRKNERALQYVESINLRGCKNITIKKLKQLNKIKTLRSIDLSWSNTNNTILQNLKKLQKLTCLEFEGCYSIKKTGFKHLSDIKEITSLSLGCTNISNNDLEYLQRIENLKMIKLNYCRKITDQGLKHLKKLTSLTSLDLRNTHITDEGISSLQESLPKTNIIKSLD